MWTTKFQTTELQVYLREDWFWNFVDFITERIIATQMDLLRLLNDGGANGGKKPKNGGKNLEESIFKTIQDTLRD